MLRESFTVSPETTALRPRRARRPGVPPPVSVEADNHIGPLLRTACGASVPKGSLVQRELSPGGRLRDCPRLMTPFGMISALFPSHPSHPRRKRSAVRRYPGYLRELTLFSVGADAYIGPLLGTTSVAPVGRGDLTPPLVHSCSPCRGRALSHPAGMVRFCANSRWFRNTSPPRVGADLCVRPRMGPATERVRADT